MAWVDTRIMIANPLTKNSTDDVLKHAVDSAVFPVMYTGPNAKGTQEKLSQEQKMLMALFAMLQEDGERTDFE